MMDNAPMAPVAHPVSLRPYTDQDLALPVRIDSEFDDFGPEEQRRALPGASLEAQGGLVVCEGGLPVGSVSWIYQQWGPNQASRCLMIGIGLDPAARGRGIGTQAQRLLVRLVFEHTRVHRIEAATDVANSAEQRALEKCGFTREGVIRGSQWRQGRFHDQWLYSLLREDLDGTGRPG
jgi:RimJ/RimL family protein N-acetyltransferase